MRSHLSTSIHLCLFAVLTACGQGPGEAEEDPATGQQAVSNGNRAQAAGRATAAELSRIRDYLDRQYKAEDVRHSFQTKHGQSIDCVDFFRHPGARRLAERGAPLTAIPTPPPPPPNLPPLTKPIGDPSDDSFNGLPDSQGRARSCPERTVPVVRLEPDTIVRDGGLDRFLARRFKKPRPPTPDWGNNNGHAHAGAIYVDSGSNITSGVTTLNILKPEFWPGVLPENFSLSQTWMGELTGTQTVEVGWIVSEYVNGAGHTDPYLFIYATNDGYQTTGCFNNVPREAACLPWVAQPGAVYAPGAKLTPGAQNELTIMTAYRSPSDSPGYFGPPAWWIYVQGASGGSYIGYYPASDFSGQQMATRAQQFNVGAEVADTTNTWVIPMGNGASATAGLGHTGYHRNYRGCTGGYAGGYTWCTSGGTFPTPTNFGAPESTEFGYNVSNTGGGSGWGPYFFYGNTPAVFWDQNYGYQWSPIGDWLGGSYKGECGLGQPITGLSKYTSGQHQGHAILCGSKTISNVTGSSCYVRDFSSGDSRAPNTGTGDWDRNYFKGECASNEFVQGIGQTTSGKVYAILCCPGTVAHQSCGAQTFYSRDSSGYSGNDWDPQFFKGQCPAGKYVSGVSSVARRRYGVVGAPHAILCCTQ
ncbi:MAG: neprosin family prolyl endopeptidase [Polyangiaceae bacterium]|nr:neprosin family prolyl endopeptidase [Polyangiaceae bacterium]